MVVLKFGGSSLSTPSRIKAVTKIVSHARSQQKAVAVVCSAFGGATDQLIEMANRAACRDDHYLSLLQDLKTRHREAIQELVPLKAGREELSHCVEKFLTDLSDVLHGVFLIREVSSRTMDYIMGFGERLSSLIISFALRVEIKDTAYLDARSVVRTDDSFGKARVNLEETNRLIREFFKENPALQIVTGFIASSAEGQTTTLGRGGSDFTASLFGAALEVEEIQIWTDVSGVLTADPRKVANAFTIPAVTYEEAMEMAHFGAKVIYPPTMAPAMRAGIPMVIKNTFEPDHPGTAISASGSEGSNQICGLTSIDKVSLLQTKGSGVIDIEGFAGRLFGTIANAGVNVILISQASSEHSICVAVAPPDAERARDAIDKAFSYEILLGQVEPVTVEANLSVIAMVGEGMRHQPGISGRIFGALGRNRINVSAIAQGSSEINVSFVIKREDEPRALRVLHDAFFTRIARVPVFMVGTGLIGKELLKQFDTSRARLLANHNLEITLMGLANSRKMVLEERGLPFSECLARLESSDTALDLPSFIDRMIALCSGNGVLVDCTANESISNFYLPVLKAGMHIVTPNKKANSASLELFRALAAFGTGPRKRFFYETNVGAGLPIIRTLEDLLASGDQVISIQAMLSGTLSYLFNTFTSTMSFAELVSRARTMGYTEPDPRDDLSGEDIARKILILARKCGHQLSLADIEVENLVPESCRTVESIYDFLADLATHDQEFRDRLAAAEARGNVLRYIATLEEGRCRVSLQEVGPDHPCYHVAGTDNVAAFTTLRYNQTPLVIKGPGAGASVTAAGVFTEIIQAGLNNF